jgi:hypothetical protein
MSRSRIALTVCAILILSVTALSATPPATSAPPLRTTDAAFLASLAAPAPAFGVPTPTPMACPAGFCMEVRRECNADCAPCLGVAVCLISICDSTCSCQC